MSNLLSGLSCRQAAIRFGVSASSAIRGRMMERVQGGATPKAFLARPALDARGPSCGCPFALVDETPDITLEELRTALAARHLWQATARCGASFTATRSRANKTAHGTEQDRPDIVKCREPGSMASRNLDPDRLVFNTARTDLDQRLPPLRMGAEMARCSESAFLICTPKQRLCRRIAP